MSELAVSPTTSQADEVERQAESQTRLLALKAELEAARSLFEQLPRDAPGRGDLKRRIRSLRANIWQREHPASVAKWRRKRRLGPRAQPQPMPALDAPGDSAPAKPPGLTRAQADALRLRAGLAAVVSPDLFHRKATGWVAICAKCGGLLGAHEDGLACHVCGRIYYDLSVNRALASDN